MWPPSGQPRALAGTLSCRARRRVELGVLRVSQVVCERVELEGAHASVTRRRLARVLRVRQVVRGKAVPRAPREDGAPWRSKAPRLLHVLEEFLVELESKRARVYPWAATTVSTRSVWSC